MCRVEWSDRLWLFVFKSIHKMRRSWILGVSGVKGLLFWKTTDTVEGSWFSTHNRSPFGSVFEFIKLLTKIWRCSTACSCQGWHAILILRPFWHARNQHHKPTSIFARPVMGQSNRRNVNLDLPLLWNQFQSSKKLCQLKYLFQPCI